MLVLVDTNVLLRVVEPRHTHHAHAAAALRVLHQTGHKLCLVPQIHYEFWVVATRPVALNGLGMTTSEADGELVKLAPPLFRFLRDERAIYDPWREVIVKCQIQGKRAHDARLVAAMRRHDLTHLLTFNVADFNSFPDIELLNPQVVGAPAS